MCIRDRRKAIPALAELAGGIGDPMVRNMGTLGGSIANADPAACYPAAVLGLGATCPVSYTHLDVYKRQCPGAVWSVPRCEHSASFSPIRPCKNSCGSLASVCRLHSTASRAPDTRTTRFATEP